MTHASTTHVIDRAAPRPRRRVDVLLIAAAALFAAILAVELLLIVRAAPALDLLAPVYVT